MIVYFILFFCFANGKAYKYKYKINCRKIFKLINLYYLLLFIIIYYYLYYLYHYYYLNFSMFISENPGDRDIP